MRIKATERYTGEHGIYELENLANELTVYGVSVVEKRNNKAIQAAFEAENWDEVARLSEEMMIDFEAID